MFFFSEIEIEIGIALRYVFFVQGDDNITGLNFIERFVRFCDVQASARAIGGNGSGGGDVSIES